MKNAETKANQMIEAQKKAANEQASSIIEEAKREKDFIRKASEKKLDDVSEEIIKRLIK